MLASSSRPITPLRAAGCQDGIHTSGSNSPRVMASSGAGSASGLAVSQPRPAASGRRPNGHSARGRGRTVAHSVVTAELAGSVLVETHDEWQDSERRYLAEHTMNLLYEPASEALDTKEVMPARIAS